MKYYNQDYFPDKCDYQCPPKDAKRFKGTIYRFSNNVDKTSNKDWIPMAKDPKKYSKWQRSNDYKSMCKGSGYSCYMSEEEAKEAYKGISSRSVGSRKKFKGFFLVKVDKLDGVLLDTSSSRNTYKHFTFWLSSSSNIIKQNFLVTRWE